MWADLGELVGLSGRDFGVRSSLCSVTPSITAVSARWFASR